MTRPRRTPPRTRHPAATSPGPRPAEKEIPETREPYDLPFPDRWPPGRPEYVIVIDQLRSLPGQSPSLAELLETGRVREPEPDREAEP